MEPTIGILIFDGVEELDFVGPWEVLTHELRIDERSRVLTISEKAGEIRCAKGLRVLADHSFTDAPGLDVLIVPGGEGTRREGREGMVEWIRSTARGLGWVCSVCTGALLLEEAGLLRGRRATTHWAFTKALRERGGIEVVEGVRFVRDGNLITAAGVSAGIDLALYLLSELHGKAAAERVQSAIQYTPPLSP